ncbi:MAG: tetratricopeptide repeat protein [Janthinobacterium lividum]
MNIDLNALFVSALAHEKAGRYQEAIADYQSALQLKPESVIAHFNLHVMYIHTNQLQLAFQELEEVERLSPNDGDIYAARAYLYDVFALKQNAHLMQELISQLPDDAKDRQVLLGLRASRKRDYPQALMHFENAVQEQPDAPYIQGYIGRTLIYLRRNAEAKKVLTIVAKDSRVRSTELYNLAVTERRLRNYAASIPVLERAVQIDNDYFKAWTLLSSSAYLSGQWKAAWHYYLESIKWVPSMQTLRSMIINR